MVVCTQIFSYAGTKDKRAITCQHVTAHRLSAERLKQWIDGEVRQGFTNLRVGNFSYVKSQLRLGMRLCVCARLSSCVFVRRA